MKKLNILQIISLTIQEIRNKPREFFRFGSPLLLLPLAWWASDKLGIDIWNTTMIFYNPVLFVAYLCIGILLAIVLVGCHRAFLMADDDIYATKTIRLGIREWNFIAWWVKLGLIIMLMSIPTIFLVMLSYQDSDSQPHDIMFFIITIPIAYISSRLSLVFPATAVGNTNTSLTKTWKLTSNNGWRLTILIGLIPLMTSFLLELLPITDSIFYYIVASITWLIVGLFELGLLSTSYAYLSGYIDDD